MKAKLLILALASSIIGILDGIGLSMFIPLLQTAGERSETVSPVKINVFTDFFEFLQTFGFQIDLTLILCLMFIFFVLKGFATFLVRYLRVLYQQYFISKIRIDSINSLENLKYAGFVESDAGLIQNVLTGEAEKIMQSFVNYTDMIQQLMMLLTYVIMAIFSNPPFAILISVGALLSNFLFTGLYRRTKSLSNKLVESNNKFQGNIIQSILFFKYLKATATIKSYSEILRIKVVEIENSNRQMGMITSIVLGAKEPITIGIVILVIYLQVVLLGGDFSGVLLSLLFFYRALTSMNAYQSSYNLFLGKIGSIDNYSTFISNLNKNKHVQGQVVFKEFKESIQFKQVSFSYNDLNQILKTVSLTIKKNQTVAFVGESGSGKSTLLNLLSGLLQPKNGQILFDGVDINQINLLSLQRKIGYITQEPVIFDDTVYNNVTLWSPKTEENLIRFWNVLEQANLKDYVTNAPLKEDVELGNNGVNLSGGQKQRITIARELYKEIDFLFLDEATSALDSETESIVQKNIESLKGKVTLIIVAHRLATVRSADLIFVLKSGEIAESGNFDYLKENSMSFQRMLSYQEI